MDSMIGIFQFSVKTNHFQWGLYIKYTRQAYWIFAPCISGMGYQNQDRLWTSHTRMCLWRTRYSQRIRRRLWQFEIFMLHQVLKENEWHISIEHHWCGRQCPRNLTIPVWRVRDTFAKHEKNTCWKYDACRHCKRALSFLHCWNASFPKVFSGGCFRKHILEKSIDTRDR